MSAIKKRTFVFYKEFLSCVFLTSSFLWASLSEASGALVLNDKDYFEQQGLNVLVFSNWYDGLFSDSKTSGVELIHHGVRTVTNGDLRLQATPEQWDSIPKFIERKVNKADGSIEAFMEYPSEKFSYSIKVQAQGDKVRITLNLPKALPKSLVNKAGFNLEFLPSAYFHKSFLMDEQAGQFPIYPVGAKEINDKVAPPLMAKGQHLVLAPETTDRNISIHSNSSPLELYDGRSKAQNGWFVVRSLIPANKKGVVVDWTLEAKTESNWIRQPMIAHSQLGYHPDQDKRAVIELDKNDKAEDRVVKLLKINPIGSPVVALQAPAKEWGSYWRYHYLTFDFTSVKEPGLYQLQFAGKTTTPFRIAKDVYQSAWYPSLDTYMPVQMDHMLIKEAYRVWHGASHLDDALQAPVNHEHFDLYAQGPTTDTPYQPGEHIPLNVGGWYDAGDFDIRTQTQYDVVMNLAETWERFKPARDVTNVNYESREVNLRVADGKPDVLQQIEHGTLGLLAQYRAVGHAIPGIVEAHITQYTHLGDGSTKTDNLIFDKSKKETESDGFRSGKFDDRWAFTSRSTPLNYGAMAALAAASRALAGYNDKMAAESLATAKKAWREEASKATPDLFHVGNTTGGDLNSEKLKAAVELLLATGDAEYAQVIEKLLPELKSKFAFNVFPLLRVMPKMSGEYKSKIRAMTVDYQKQLADMEAKNPFGVLITEFGWAGSGTVIRVALNNYYLHKSFPDLVSRESVLKGLNYILGNHPVHNLSLVSGVGAESKEVAYGNNRADFSFIAGGVVPGILVLKPDYPENHEDWPFFWGENEYVVDEAAAYILLVNAANDLLAH